MATYVVKDNFPTIVAILPQNALRRDCNDKCIEWIEGHYEEVVVEVYFYCMLIAPLQTV